MAEAFGQMHIVVACTSKDEIEKPRKVSQTDHVDVKRSEFMEIGGVESPSHATTQNCYLSRCILRSLRNAIRPGCHDRWT